MDGLIAWKERSGFHPITGQEGVLRKEWRLVPRKSVPEAELRDAAGPYLHIWCACRWIVQRRYIRYGVEEPWTLHAPADTWDEVYSNLDSPVVLEAPELVVIAQRQADAERQRKAEAEAKAEHDRRAADDAAARAAGQACFARMLASPRWEVLAQNWQNIVLTCNLHPEWLAAHAEVLRPLNNACLLATTISAKAKLIRQVIAYCRKEGLKW